MWFYLWVEVDSMAWGRGDSVGEAARWCAMAGGVGLATTGKVRIFRCSDREIYLDMLGRVVTAAGATVEEIERPVRPVGERKVTA